MNPQHCRYSLFALLSRRSRKRLMVRETRGVRDFAGEKKGGTRCNNSFVKLGENHLLTFWALRFYSLEPIVVVVFLVFPAIAFSSHFKPKQLHLNFEKSEPMV